MDNLRFNVLRKGCSLPTETCPSPFFFEHLGLSDTEDVKYRNARLSLYNW